MQNLKTLEIESKKHKFEPCSVEVVHFGEDIILASVGDSTDSTGMG